MEVEREALVQDLSRVCDQRYLPASEAVGYVINGTDRVKVTDTGVMFEGRCFKYSLR